MLRITRKHGQSLVLLNAQGEIVCELKVELRKGQVSVGIESDRSEISVKRKEILNDEEIELWRTKRSK